MFHIILTLFAMSFFNPSAYFACASYVVDDDTGVCLSEQQSMSVPVATVLFIAFVNDFCMLAISRDTVAATDAPQRWRLGDLFASAATLGSLASIGSLGLLLVCLRAGDHVDGDGAPSRPAPFDGDGDGALACVFFDESGDGRCSVSYGQTMGILFLRLALSDLFTVFAARTRWSFAARMPSLWLLAAALCSFALSVLITALLPVVFGAGDSIIPQRTLWLVVAYSALAFAAQDAVKVAAFVCFRACARARARLASRRAAQRVAAAAAAVDEQQRGIALSSRRSGWSGASSGRFAYGSAGVRTPSRSALKSGSTRGGGDDRSNS